MVIRTLARIRHMHHYPTGYIYQIKSELAIQSAARFFLVVLDGLSTLIGLPIYRNRLIKAVCSAGDADLIYLPATVKTYCSIRA